MLKISPVITEISQQGSPYFLIARAYPFFSKNAEQFVPGPIHATLITNVSSRGLELSFSITNTNQCKVCITILYRPPNSSVTF